MKLSKCVVLSLGIFGVFQSAWAQEFLDQEQLFYNGGTSARTLPGYKIWQSVTPASTGTLTHLEMGFFNSMNGLALLEIFSGQGIHGLLLESDQVSVQAVNGSVSWNRWALDVPVTAGEQFTFCITPNAATLPDPYGVCIGSGNPYQRGTMGITDPSGDYPVDFDTLFKTYVTPVPEPASLSALLAGFFVIRRRRNS